MPVSFTISPVSQGMITPGEAETGDLLHPFAQHAADFLARRVGDIAPVWTARQQGPRSRLAEVRV